jgi:hypothetical protein
MGTKSRESIYGSSIQASAERAAEARKQADRLACEAWNQRMVGYKGPAQPSPALGDALNAGYRYLEVRCLGCTARRNGRPPCGALILVPTRGGPTMLTHIGVMRALHRDVERVFNADRKDPHWGKRTLKRDR